MHLVDDDEAQVGEQPVCVGGIAHQHTFEGLGRSLNHALRTLHNALLRGLRRIAVPFGDGYLSLLEKSLQSLELVVDKRLQRTQIQHAHARRGILP